jgi:hypothetical protein
MGSTILVDARHAGLWPLIRRGSEAAGRAITLFIMSCAVARAIRELDTLDECVLAEISRSRRMR